jgi:aspartate aminotransferase
MKIPTVSERLIRVPASPIRKLVPFANAAKKEAIHVYHLNIGDPDIQTPDVMIKALRTWDKNPISYSSSQGEPVFLDALVWYYHSLGFSFIRPNHIQVTTGGSEAISMALFSVANPGDDVLIFEPFYTNYNSYAAVHSVRLVPIPTDIQNGFHLPTKDVIEKSMTSKTKAILICSPNNPTGTVYTKAEMDMLVDIVTDHGLYLLSDEVYREFVYDGITHVSLLSYMQDIPKQAIVLDSLSKRYSLCGARLGMLVSLNDELMQRVLYIAQGRLSSGLIDQIMASHLTEVPKTYVDSTQKEYKKRRDVLYDGLRKIPGVVIHKPEGAFYAIVGLPIDDAEDFAKYLLTTFRDNNETVMVAPAAGFYATPGCGKNEIRIAYVLNEKALRRSIDILRNALKAYNRKQ